MDQTQHIEQTTTHPSSHGEDEVGEGGRSGYPSDLQTALQKLHVTHSEERDRTEELFDSETSHPVSSRTRSKVSCGGVSRGASGHREEIDYEDTGPRDDGVSTECNIVRPAARGDRATFGAQRGASLNCADLNPPSDVEQLSEVEGQDEGSDVYVSSVEDHEEHSESEDDRAHIRWQYCDSEVAVKRPQSRSSRTGKRQSLQRGDKDSHEQRGLVTSDARVQKSSHDGGYKDSRAVQTHSLVRDHSSQPMPTRKGHAADEEASVDRRQRAACSEARVKPANRPMKVLQSRECTNRPSVIDRSNVKSVSAAAVPMKEIDRRVSQPRGSRCDKCYSHFSDSETEMDETTIPRRRPGRSHKGELTRKSARGRMKERERDSSKENYSSSDEKWVNLKNRQDSWYEDDGLDGDSRRKCRSSSSVESKHQHASHHRNPGCLKPEKFDGTTCFETFLVQFDNCAQFNCWNDMEKLHYLRWSLTGPAARMLWGTEEMTFRQLVARLRSRFGSFDMEEKYQAELQCRRRKPSETLRELAQDIRRLMMLAYPGDRSDMAERLAKEHFICAFDEPELELKVREKEPQTLDAALKYAQRFEVFRNAVRQRRQRLSRQVTESSASRSSSLEERVAKIEQGLQKTRQQRDDLPKQHRQKVNDSNQSDKYEKKDRRSGNKRTCATTVNNDEAWKNELLKKIQELEHAQQVAEANTKKVAAENDALNKEVEHLRHLEQLRSVPAPTVRPLLQQGSDIQPRVTGNCYNCSQPGHFAKFCPHRPARGSAGIQYRSDNGSNRCRTYGALESSYLNHESYLRVSIGHQVYDCLLDTGSEVCLFPESVVGSVRVNKTNRTLKAANGMTIPILGEVNLPVNIGSYSTRVVGLVSQHVPEPMLGIDFLTRNKAVWDFDKGLIWIANKSYLLHHRSDRYSWCRRVVLQEDVVVPARSEAVVSTRMQFRKLPNKLDDEDWSTELSCVKDGLHVSRTLIPRNSWTDIPVRVMNVKKEPVSLKCNTVMSHLQQVEVVKEDVQHGSNVTQAKLVDSEENFVPDYLQKLIDDVDDSIPESTCLALEAILVKHADVFSQDENDLGRTNIIMHYIDTGEARPVRQPLRRYPAAHIEAISEHVDNMLKQGTIEPASSPWASNVVLVKKKDGSLRCCIDYRQLNSVTRKDVYPLPRIDDCLDAMSSATLFSTFDLRSSYHQVEVAPHDRDKTTFICPRGMYRYRTMPFGLCNAGATFQRLMDVVMSGLHLDVCLVYLDDIVVFSKTIEEHLERLVRVLGRLRSAGLKLKPEKCRLIQKSVSFLGHVVSDKGIATDPEKTRLVSKWPVPASIKEVRSFLGLTGYYRRFVKNYATIAAPLHFLTKKDQPFVWTEETQKAFEALKEALTSPPILAMPNDTGEFVLDTDACDRTIGAVLSQTQDGVEKVIAYAGRSLDKREVNYCTTRKELLAIVYSLKYFKQYLMGRRFKIRTDHAPLTWLRRTPDPVGQQARWLEIMEEYDFVVEHRPGVKHANADAISRRPCPVKSCACRRDKVEEDHMVKSVSAGNGLATATNDADSTDDVDTEFWSIEGLRAAQKSDPDVSCVLNLMENSTEKPPWDSIACQSHDVRVLWSMWPRLRIWNGILQRRFESLDGLSVIWQVILPKKLRKEFLSVIHGGMTGGHLARRRTAASIQSRAYWPTWSSDLDAFLRECEPCARYHRGSVPKKAHLRTPLVGEPWFRVSVDITGPHPRSSKSNQYILTLVDHFSKWAEAIPLRNHTAPTVARALMVHVFSKFGAPWQLLTDRGSEFESELFKELMNWMEIDKLRTTAFHPSCNGVVERFHRTLNSMLGKVVSESQRDWDERLPLVLAAYRATPHESTGMTPNRLFLGHEVRMPIDIVMGLPPEETSGMMTAHDYLSKLHSDATEAYRLAREKLRASAERRKRSYDVKVKTERFKVGDWVYYHYPRRFQSRSAKWQKSYIGPFLVVRVIEPVNCVLQKSAKSKPFVVHVDKLKKCFGTTPTAWVSESDQ